MGLKTNKTEAAKDMAKALKGVFEKYSFDSRQKAWEALQKGNGRLAMEKLLIHPSGPTTGFNKLSFKEWLNEEEKVQEGFLGNAVSSVKKHIWDDPKTTFKVVHIAFQLFKRDMAKTIRALFSKYGLPMPELDEVLKNLSNFSLSKTMAGARENGRLYGRIMQDLTAIYGKDVGKMFAVLFEMGLLPPIPGKIYSYITWMGPHLGVAMADTAFGKWHNQVFPIWMHRAMQLVGKDNPNSAAQVDQHDANRKAIMSQPQL